MDKIKATRQEYGGKVGGVQPSSLCAQLEYLADLPRNRMNPQWNPSLYEVLRQKIAEDIEKQTVSRVCWDGKVPGMCPGTKAAAAPNSACCRIRGGEL